MTAPTFLAPPADLMALQPGDSYTLSGAEGRHARVVQRLTVGQRLDLVDGDGLRLKCAVAGGNPSAAPSSKDELPCTVFEREAEPQPNPTITLVQGLAKGDASELAISQAVEVGADAIVPWQSEHAVVVWRADRAAKSQAKWEQAVSRAVKQSRRAYLPPVCTVVDTLALARQIRETIPATPGNQATRTNTNGLALILDGDAQLSLADIPLPSAGNIMVIVGPEGGISTAELTELTAAGAVPVTAGPHVMRSSTAGAVAIAAISLRLGRWSRWNTR